MSQRRRTSLNTFEGGVSESSSSGLTVQVAVNRDERELVHSDVIGLAVTQMEVYRSGRGFPGGKASSVIALRRFLRSFDLGSTLGDDLGTKVDVYESVDLPLGRGTSWLNFTNAARLAAAEGAADFVSRSFSDRLTASRTASI